MVRIGFSAILLLVCSASADEVRLTGSTSPSTVLVDAAFATGCANDVEFHGSPTGGQTQIDIGNADSHNDCPAELIVMSRAHALVLREANFSSAHDEVVIPLDDLLKIPVRTRVLLVRPYEDPQKEEDKKHETAVELNAASSVFAESGAGIEFVNDGVTFVVDKEWVSMIRELTEQVRRGEADGRALRKAIKQRFPPNLNEISAYRIEAEDVSGIHLREDDGSSSGILVIGSDGTDSTLAHELGHALSLDHVAYWGFDPRSEEVGTYCVAYGLPSNFDGACDFVRSNLMWSGHNDKRDYLTAGQAFRAAVNARSFVNSGMPPLRPPSEPTRRCEDWRYSDDCPYIAPEAP